MMKKWDDVKRITKWATDVRNIMNELEEERKIMRTKI
jgi:hypothetical protein